MSGGLRVGRAQLEVLRDHLSERDHAVLASLDAHRFVLTSQLQRLHFASHRTASAGIRACTRALDRLKVLGLIDRLARKIGGRDSGSRGFVWTLTPVGDRLVRRRAETEAPRRRRFEPTVLFLDHTLAVAELHVQLAEADRAGRLELDQVETEPACWRDYVAPHGNSATLKPDLAFVTADGDYETHYFAELDRGTESIRTLLAKCEQYERYRQSGREQRERGVFPLVLWVMPDEKRRDRLLREIESSHALDPALYRVITADGFIPLLTGQSPPTAPRGTPSPASTLERRNP